MSDAVRPDPEVWVDVRNQKVRFKIGVQTFTLEVLPVEPGTFSERLEWYCAELRHAFQSLLDAGGDE